jgi:citrate synthase
VSDSQPYLTAAEAARRLGVSLQTLYAYVSRGMLASEATPGEPRARRYLLADVERLRGRREGRRHPERVAARALAWGEPVLDSALTLAHGGHLYYRGHDAVRLARERSLEEVAALLWTGDAGAAEDLFAGAAAPPAAVPRLLRGLVELAPVERMQALLPIAAAADDAAWDLRPEGVARCGARVLRVALAAAVGPAAAVERRRGTRARRSAVGRPGAAAVRLAVAWCAGRPRAAEAIAAILVLSADHELNVSTFAARCAASAAATPWDAVAAGLAALKGRRHGGASLRAAALLEEATRGEAERLVAERLRAGEEVPGFGHPLHPAGDPRGAELLAVAAAIAPRSRHVRAAQQLTAAAHTLLHERPNVDLGLATLAGALNLPAGAAMALFALGRTVGWIAHAQEEYTRDRLIRPRARYVGPAPG